MNCQPYIYPPTSHMGLKIPHIIGIPLPIKYLYYSNSLCPKHTFHTTSKPCASFTSFPSLFLVFLSSLFQLQTYTFIYSLSDASSWEFPQEDSHNKKSLHLFLSLHFLLVCSNSLIFLLPLSVMYSSTVFPFH